MPRANRISVTPLTVTKLFAAIDEPIMELRIAVQKLPIRGIEKEMLDKKLFNLSNIQWKEICEILKIEKP